MTLIARLFAAFSFSFLFLAPPAVAQTGEESGFPAILEPVKGPSSAQLRGLATLNVPGGYVYIGEKHIAKFLEMTGNQPSPSDIGALLPEADDWIIFFSYEDIGYVKDDDKDALDPEAILTSIREGNEQANAYRRERGIPPMEVVGWDQPPFYDEETKNLTWALRGRSEGHDIINYNSRVLGRGGVMSVNLVCDPTALASVVPIYKQLITNDFAYNPGQRYAEWRQGDKVAAYGLTALVTGGGIAVAAKTGLLAKLGKSIKLIVVGAIAAVAAIGRAVRRFFGGGQQTTQ